MDMVEFRRRALTVPFVVRGRDWSGWDCWGLIYLAHRDVLNISIDPLDDDYDDDVSFAQLDLVVRDQRESDWNEVPKPAVGDVALFRVSRFQSHVALVCERGQMLHTTRTTGTVVERLDNLAWAKRHVGYFRHRTRAA